MKGRMGSPVSSWFEKLKPPCTYMLRKSQDPASLRKTSCRNANLHKCERPGTDQTSY